MQGQEPGLVDTLKHLVLPAFASAFVSIGVTARMTRASLLETYGEDFVTTLRAKGLGAFQILRHVGKNSLSPVLTVVGLQVGFLLGGSVLVETIFSWPGLGQLIYQAISSRDFRVIQAAVLVTSVLFVFTNLAVDMLQLVIDPRLRNAGR
jgi:peptide/nickel transport system permease protein